MNQRETVARALARVEYDSDEDFEIAVDSGHAPSCEWYRYVDAVLAALGLGEGGENVVVPREPTEAMKVAGGKRYYARSEPLPFAERAADAYRAMISARPQDGEAGE